jgi:hypothetical protein
MSISKNKSIVMLVIIVFALFYYLTRNQSVSEVDNVVLLSTTDSSLADNERITNLENQVNEISTQQSLILENLKQVLLLAKNSNNEIEHQQNTVSASEKNSLSSITPVMQQTQQEIIQQEQQQFNLVENSFEIESRDDAWSVSEESKIRTILETKNLGEAKINSIDCRSQTCRADIAHKDQASADDFMDEFMHSLGNNSSGEMRFRGNSEGGIDTIMYIIPSNG